MTKRRKGSLLAVAILTTSILVLLVAIIGSSTIFHMQNTTQVGGKKEARYVAYSGIQEAMARLLADEATCDRWPYTFDGTMPGDASLRYEVAVWSNITGVSPKTVPGTSKNVPGGAAYIDSTGYREGSSGPRTKIVGGMAGLAMKNKPVFDQAAYGDLFVGLANGSWTDSYDSFGGYFGPPPSAPSGVTWSGGNSGNSGGGGNNSGGGNSGGGGNGGGGNVIVGEGTVASAGFIELGSGVWVDGNAELSPIAKLNALFAGSTGSTTGSTSGAATTGSATTGSATGIAAGGTSSSSSSSGDPERVRLEGGVMTGTTRTAAEPTVVPGFRAPYQKTDLDPDINTATLPRNTGGGGGGGGGNNDDNGPGNNGPPPPPPPPPSGELPPNSTYKNVTVPPGDRVKLKSGTYYISDTFSSDGAEIEIDASGGPVILYVGYQMNLKNTNILNLNPRDLQIYFTDEVPEEVLAASGTAATGGATAGGLGHGGEPTEGGGAALNPGSLFNVEGGSGTFVAAGKDTTVSLKSTEVFGSVVGQVVTANASSIHYDKTLKGMPLGGVSDWILEGLHETTR